MSLTEADKAYIAMMDARADDGWKGSKVPGAPQIHAFVKESAHAFPKMSRAAKQWSGQGIKGVEHVPEGQKHAGNVIFKTVQAQRDYCKAEGYSRDYHHDD